jgi:hypothetical protein
MKNARAIKNAHSKKPRKRLPYKELIVTLAKLIAKDAAKAELSEKLQKQIVKELGKVLQQVDAKLPFISLKCWCTYDGAASCILKANCLLLGGHCAGNC